MKRLAEFWEIQPRDQVQVKLTRLKRETPDIESKKPKGSQWIV